MAVLAVPSLTVLDVGHGSCAILAEVTRIIVFDAGPKTGLLEFLLQHQIDTIDLVMISHADRDHIEGLIAEGLTSQFRPTQLSLLCAVQSIFFLTFSPP